MSNKHLANLPGMTDAEKAYFESSGAVDPTTGKPAEEEPNDTGTNGPDAENNSAGPGEADAAGKADAPADPEPESDGDEEVVDVANADGETRRKMIAFGAYEKQRKQSKALKGELEKAQQQLAYLTGLVHQKQGGDQPAPKTEQPQQVSATAPDPQKEPEKWLTWVNTTLAQTVQAQQQNQTLTAQQKQEQQINALAYQAEQDFVSGDEPHPDYYDALKFLDKSRRDELKMLGYDASTAQQIIDAQNKDIAIRALQTQNNPAERFYSLAKARGFNAPKPKPTETEAQVVARQAKNQETNKSIAKLAGGAAANPLSLENLANMSTKEFAKRMKAGELQDILGMG